MVRLNARSTTLSLTQQSLPSLVLFRGLYRECVVLIVHHQNFIAHLYRADAFRVAMTIDLLKQFKVQLLVFKNFVIVETTARLFAIELVFKDSDLIV